MTVFQTQFFWWFLSFYVIHEIVHLGLDLMNYRYTKKQSEIPLVYQGRIDKEQFLKSKNYTLEKARFSIFSHLCLIPFFWLLIFAEGFNAFDDYAAYYAGEGSLSHSVLFCLFLSMYFGVIQMPFRLYSIFVIEEKYGFNKMTFKLFVVDFVKSILLGALIGLPVLYLIFWFMKASGSFWWLWVWGLLTGFQLIMVSLYPTFLAPLFNKFTPLIEGELHDRIVALAHKIQFKLSGVFTIDGSKRSGHSNAYFAGMGRFRRIVLFDTLIDQLSTDELVAVLAHEMGHNVKKHIRNFMLVSSFMSLVGFYILSLLVQWPDFYAAFNISHPSMHAALVIFVLSSDVFTFALTPIMNLFSRRNEYEADHFSVQVTEDPKAMKQALFKLTKENLSNLTPHPWYSFYHYSHPTAAERASAIDHIKLDSSC